MGPWPSTPAIVAINNKIEGAENALKKYLKDIQETFDEKKQKITRGHDLAPGVIKIV